MKMIFNMLLDQENNRISASLLLLILKVKQNFFYTRQIVKSGRPSLMLARLHEFMQADFGRNRLY
ncbi:hypothetical protein D3C84_1060860 [compost metagenome]